MKQWGYIFFRDTIVFVLLNLKAVMRLEEFQGIGDPAAFVCWCTRQGYTLFFQKWSLIRFGYYDPAMVRIPLIKKFYNQLNFIRRHGYIATVGERKGRHYINTGPVFNKGRRW